MISTISSVRLLLLVVEPNRFFSTGTRLIKGNPFVDWSSLSRISPPSSSVSPLCTATWVWMSRWLIAGFVPELAEYPRWAHGDALDILPDVEAESFDYALSCPPYWNRERYSDDPRDLSRMPWPKFLAAHAEIIEQTIRTLKPHRFATWVISDVRDSKGHLRSLPARTVEAFEAGGARLINEQVLISPAGTLAKTMRPAWEACSTTTRRHQLVLTFVKGDRREATRNVDR